jgi:TolB-like protein/class 3 adenylate cyclase/Tfp pilus assembly protein PilF
MDTEHRKLAAIMFTDMVGYSTLVQRSEKLALELLQEHRKLLRGFFPNYNGTEIKTIGDAFLVEFGSALEAAECAIAIQRAVRNRNACAPDGHQIHLRIGIHIGDVVHTEGDVFGDGVNIASRIESMAGVDGICITVDVERQIRNSLDARLERMGAAELKNIRIPMELFRIVLPGDGATAVPPQASSAKSPKKARWLLLGLGLAGIVIGTLTLVIQSRGPDRAAGFRQGTDAAIHAASVAVLPFANLGPDKTDDYLSDGISEEIIAALTRLKGLKVPARTSCFAYRNKSEDIRQIGRKLNVSHILEGSISRSGEQLRVTAQLINVFDGFHVWSDTYDRQVADLLGIRAEIAAHVAEALRGRLMRDELRQLEKGGEANPEAHRLYLQGRSLWNRRTGESLRKAIELLDQALLKDPTYALAYAGLADCYVVLPEYAGLPMREACAKARAAAARALELDPELAQPHATLAVIKMSFEWDWSAAEADFRKAIALDPKYSTAHHWYAIFLRDQGRLEEALREIRVARELDPLSPMINNFTGTILSDLGKHEEAMQVIWQQIAFDPSFAAAHESLGHALMLAGRYEDALTEFETAARLAGNETFTLGQVGIASAYAGKTARAEAVLKRLQELQQQGQDKRTYIASLQHLLGRDDEALESLERAVTEKAHGVIRLKVNFVFEKLRPSPRFQALLKRLNF